MDKLYVSQPHNRTERTATQYAGTFNLTEGVGQKSFSSVYTNQNLDIPETTSTTVLPSFVKLSRQLRRSTTVGYSKYSITLGTTVILCCNSTSNSEGLKLQHPRFCLVNAVHVSQSRANTRCRLSNLGCTTSQLPVRRLHRENILQHSPPR